MSQFDDDLEDKEDDYTDDQDESDSLTARRSASNPFSSGARPPGSGSVPTPNRVNDPSRLPGGGGGPLPRPGMGSSSAPGSGSPARPNPSSFGGGSSSGSGSSSFNRPSASPSPGGSGSPSGSGVSSLNRPSSAPTSAGSSSPPRPSSSSSDDASKNKSGGGLLGGRFGGSKDDKKDAQKDSKSSGGGLSGLGKGLPGRFGGGGDDKPATPKGTLRTGENKPAGGGLGGFGKGLTSRFGRGGDDKPAAPTSTGSMPGARPGTPSPTASAPRFGSSGGSSSLGSAASPARPAAPKAPGKSLGERFKALSPFKKGPARPARQRQSKPVSVTSEGMSLDTKLDILGVALILSALALIFSAISTTQGQLTGGINHFLGQNLGWGAIAAPVTMFAVGVWLILRHFGENAPTLEVMTVIGIAMLYVGLLVLFQYIDSLNYVVNPQYSYLGQLRLILLPQAYMAGRGGGWVGAEIYYFLVSNLTEIGGFFILLAWMIIGIMLSVNISAAQLAMAIISVWRSFSDARRRRAQARAIEQGAQVPAVASGLPQLAVGKPAAEQLPLGARSPQLPAPTADVEERPIPVMTGGRAPSPFRAAEAVPLADATTRAAPAPAAPAAATPASGNGSRFGAFASRMRDAIPTPGAKATDADQTSAQGDKPAGGLFGSITARVREAVPSIPIPIPTPAVKASDSALKPSAASSAADVALPTAQPAALSASPVAAQAPTAAAADEAEAVAVPGVRPGAIFTRPGSSSAVSPASAPDRRASKPSPSGFSSDLDAVDDEDEIEDNAPPGRLGEMLRPSAATTPAAAPTASGSAPLPRPGLNRPLPPTSGGPRSSASLPSPFARPAAPAPAAGAPTEAVSSAVSGDPLSRPTAPPSSASGLRPGASNFHPPTPAPSSLRAAAAAVDDADDEAEDQAAGTPEAAGKPLDLTPARPKGIGPLPRPTLSNPFNHATPPRPMGTLQERMEALRNGRPDTPEDDAETSARETGANETATQSAAAVKADEPTVQAAAPARRDDDLDALPTLTQRRSLGINPFGSSRESKPPAAAAPAAFQMPERPVPPTPIKPAGYVHENAPPPSTLPASMKSIKDDEDDTPAPPKPIRAARHAWTMPEPTRLLTAGADQEQNNDALRRQGKKIEETLTSFGAPGRVVEIRSGPVITQFGVEPDYLAGRSGKKIRVKVGAIAQLDKDLQLALGARSIRIEAPVPGKGYVGIEVPNAEPSVVRLRDVLESDEFRRVKSPLGIALGQSVDGTPVAADLAAMPHLLIAGTTGSGKSVCVNTIIASLLIRNAPDRLKFIMVDPKRVELTGYNGIPHLVAPVVVELERIVSVLKWVTREMDERYKKFSSAGARNIEDFNRHLPSTEPVMPYIVVIIDELADLMMLAPDETERVITRIAALARATGIHLVIATQRPSVDVVTGLIKANFPARIAFAVAGGVDSRVILDQPGAEKLLGRGDMLYMSGDAPAPVRLQGVYVSDTEINNITRFWRDQTTLEDLSARPIMPPSGMSMDDTGRDIEASAGYGAYGAKSGAQRQPDAQAAFWDHELSDSANNRGFGAEDGEGDDGEDAMYDEAVELVRRLNKASVSLLQRRLRIGYTRAARLIDLMEQRGIVGPATEGSKPRDVVG